MNTIEHLQVILPGQPIAWYQRIAVEIEAGRMPMPSSSTPVETQDLPPPPSSQPSQFISRSQIPTRLLKFCGNQRSVAEFMVSAKLKDFPDKSIEWCVKHVLLDFSSSRR
jgi:hypothetical protein